MNSHRLFAVLLVLVGVGACQQKTDESKELATVNGQTITENDFKRYLQQRQSREPISDKAQERKVLDEMIDRVLLAQRAKANGVDKDPEVQSVLQRVQQDILVQAMIHNTLKDSPITDDELKDRFDKEVAATHKTEYLVRHILTKNEDEAKDIIAQLNGKKANFAALAKEKSIDLQSRNNGGTLGWINQGMEVPEFFEGVTQIAKGTTGATPIKSAYGWHVIHVDDTRPAKIPTYEEFMANRQAKASFYRKLQDERIEKTLKDLRADAKVVVKAE
jgi:peptidyl-prolyl cis-trans isomerase C